MRARISVSIGLCLTLALAACSSGPAGDKAVSVGDPPAAPVSEAAQELPESASIADRIEAALEAGEIDASTASKYVVWAAFGSPELPPEFDSDIAGVDGVDLAHIGANLEALNEQDRGAVEPFFKRPSDPDSAFSEPSGVKSAAVNNPTQTGGAAQMERCANWESEAVPNVPFRVWACANTDDPSTVFSTLTPVLQAHVPEMTRPLPAGMGQPIPDIPDSDGGNPDDLIDIYVLPTGWMAPKRGLNERLMDEISTAITMRTAPMSGFQSSSYILFNSELLDNPEPLERITVHEVFHVLQNALYDDVTFENRWLFEGGAKWAENYYTDLGTPVGYDVRVKEMQDSALGLEDPDFQHSYSSFIWFTFMAQNQGVKSVFAFWESLRDDPPATGHSPFTTTGAPDLDEAFPPFALQLLNVKLPGDPISPRFSDDDPYFPDASTPNLSPVVFDTDELSLDGQGIPSLGYRYTHVTFSEETPLVLRHDLATPSGAQPVAEALIADSDGNYERVRIGSDEAVVCTSDDIYFVMSNPSIILDDASTGSVTLAAGVALDCDDSAEGPGPSLELGPDPDINIEAEPKPETSDYCSDLGWLNDRLEDLAANPRALSATEVEEMFAIADPYLYDMVDGGRG